MADDKKKEKKFDPDEIKAAIKCDSGGGDIHSFGPGNIWDFPAHAQVKALVANFDMAELRKMEKHYGDISTEAGQKANSITLALSRME